MEKIFAPPLADNPNIERDRRRSVSEMWTSLLCNIETDAAASVAALEERYFCKHRYSLRMTVLGRNSFVTNANAHPH